MDESLTLETSSRVHRIWIRTIGGNKGLLKCLGSLWMGRVRGRGFLWVRGVGVWVSLWMVPAPLVKGELWTGGFRKSRFTVCFFLCHSILCAKTQTSSKVVYC